MSQTRIAFVLVGVAYAFPALAQHVHSPVKPTPSARDTATNQPADSTTADQRDRPPTQQEISAAFPDASAMDMRHHMNPDPWITTLQMDALEYAFNSEATHWDSQLWSGKTHNRALLRSSGERDTHGSSGQVELLWSHATGPWWNRTLGIAHAFGGAGSRNWLAFGVVGLAPYKFEVQATGYLSQDGWLAAAAKAHYDVLLTNRLILQPEIEAKLQSRNAETRRDLGANGNEWSAGLRLRYEVHRQFAPYFGYRWQRSFGTAANLRRAAGFSTSERSWIVGVRFWF